MIQDDGEKTYDDFGELEEKHMIFHLRLDIIKAQMCMQAYFKWRNEQREYNSKTVKKQFQKMLLDQNIIHKYSKAPTGGNIRSSIHSTSTMNSPLIPGIN